MWSRLATYTTRAFRWRPSEGLYSILGQLHHGNDGVLRLMPYLGSKRNRIYRQRIVPQAIPLLSVFYHPQCITPRFDELQ